MKWLLGSSVTICKAFNSEKSIASPVWCRVTLYLLISFTAYHVRLLITIPERTLPNPPSPMRALNIMPLFLTDATGIGTSLLSLNVDIVTVGSEGTRM